MSYLRVTMSAIVDDNSRPVDPEAEVRKLQDLVKKLEHQNQILRKKQQHRDPDGNVLNTKLDSLDTNHVNKTQNSANIRNKNRNEKSANVTLDDFDLLDIENLTLEDEEDNWLYESPKKTSPAQKSVDPCQWVREEFEHPSPEIEGVKRSLLYKLEEVSNRADFYVDTVSRSSSSGNLGSAVSPVSGEETPTSYQHNHTHHSSSSPNLRNGPLSFARKTLHYEEQNHSQTPTTGIKKTAAMSGLGSRLDTGTFTRPKKQSRLGLGTGTIRLTRDQQDNLERPVIRSQDEEDEDDVCDDNDGANFRVGSPVEDVTELNTSEDTENLTPQKLDVHALAKLQEESLRQSFTSSGTTPRKSLSKSMNRSGFGLGAPDSGSSPDNSARSSPGRIDGEVYQATSRSNNSLASPSSQSSLGSPPDSPHGSSQHLDRKPHHLMETRRSLPNLARMAHPQGLQLYSAKTRESPVRDSSLGRNVTRQPGSGARQASPARAMSPQRPGIPVPRSSIPRPGSSSRLPTPKKSGIPAPPRRSLTAPRSMDDESWKEGCF